MAQEELQESKLTKAGGRKPTHGCSYPMVGWPSVILTPVGPSLNLTREGTSRPSLRSSLSLSESISQRAEYVGHDRCINPEHLVGLVRLSQIRVSLAECCDWPLD